MLARCLQHGRWPLIPGGRADSRPAVLQVCACPRIAMPSRASRGPAPLAGWCDLPASCPLGAGHDPWSSPLAPWCWGSDCQSACSGLACPDRTRCQTSWPEHPPKMGLAVRCPPVAGFYALSQVCQGQPLFVESPFPSRRLESGPVYATLCRCSLVPCNWRRYRSPGVPLLVGSSPRKSPAQNNAKSPGLRSHVSLAGGHGGGNVQASWGCPC